MSESSHKHAFLLSEEDLEVRRQDGEKVVLNYDGKAQRVSVILGCFPLEHPGRMMAFYDERGEEIGVLNNAGHLDGESRQIIREELERSYFMPEIKEIRDVTKLLNVHKWEVVTDRGQRTFEIRRPKRNIRKLRDRRLLIHDVDGNRYDIPNWKELPEDSQVFLEEYT